MCSVGSRFIFQEAFFRFDDQSRNFGFVFKKKNLFSFSPSSYKKVTESAFSFPIRIISVTK